MPTKLAWARVSFSATGGRTEALLQASAQHGFGLRKIRYRPGGFTAHCPAHQYLKLARFAMRYRVHTRVMQKYGFYFQLRKTLRRKGFYAGLAVFGILLLVSQQFIWNISYSSMTLGQRTRASEILRGCGIEIGAKVNPDAFVKGETALVEGSNGEFGWASLNFTGGRLTVELEPAEPVPDIAQNRTSDICARINGQVVAMDVQKGTAAVVIGQEVAAGQVLIASNRTDRKGAPVPGYTAGTVQARFSWDFEIEQPLVQQIQQPDVSIETKRSFLLFGQQLSSGTEQAAAATDAESHRRHGAIAVLGMTLPISYCETETINRHTTTVVLTESLALAKARLAAARVLKQEWPDAVTETVQEDYCTENGKFSYFTTRRIVADICER